MATSPTYDAVIVSLEELVNSTVSFGTLEAAFGPSSLGILIVKDLPSKYTDLRARLLSYASYLANLPQSELDDVTCPEARYLTGWSHGKEALKPGVYDTMKGSFYVNCAHYQEAKAQIEIQRPPPVSDLPPNPKSSAQTSPSEFPEFSRPNLWPPDAALPLFRSTFEELCTLIIDTAVLVAGACDRYAEAKIPDYEKGYLQRVVQTSVTTKARLLHYFPPSSASMSSSSVDQDRPRPNDTGQSNDDDDDWCATHVDHGCLTGLTSAAYIDESSVPFPGTSPSSSLPSSTKPIMQIPLPFLASAPSKIQGLYIHARDSTVTKVSIPHDCLAFQTGEALELITGGKFRAVPHFVRGAAPGDGQSGNYTAVARNTLAVFTQPNLNEVIDQKTGKTFAAFSKEVAERFG